MKLVNVKQMILLESQADKKGLSYAAMMANAGLALAEVVHKRYFKRPMPVVIGLVGTGNNGGDTLVALSHLASWGWRTLGFLVKPRDEQDKLATDYQKVGGELFLLKNTESFTRLRKNALEADCIIDGILGTGVRLPLRGEAQKVLAYLSELKDLPPVIAVDCPSGVDCDSGEADQDCLPAELTICMAAVKKGLLQQPALDLCGEILAVDIGLPENLSAWKNISTEVVDARVAASCLPDRPLDGHKGTFGTALIAAGSINYCGAVLLAARGAYRVGTGLVRAAIPGAIYDTLAGQMPETTWLILPHTLGVFNGEAAGVLYKNLGRTDALLVGPGWGQDDETLAFLRNLLSKQQPLFEKSQIGFSGMENKDPSTRKVLPNLVIDADALKLLAKIDNWEKQIDGKAVLTPHPGEMAAMTGLDIAEIQANRENIACEYAKRWGQVVVLKGALTIVADTDGKCALIPVASTALATAGTGDVLAGMITGLLAQGVEPYEASMAGAWLHARAGVKASHMVGGSASVLASDVIDALPSVLKQTGGI